MRLCWPTAWYNKQRLVDEVNRLNDQVEQLVAQRNLVDATLVRVETERLKQERDAARSAVDLGVALLLAADAPKAAEELDKRRTWLPTDEETR